MMRHLAVLMPLLLVPMAGAGAGVCRDVGAGQEAGQMEDKSMEEASGLAMTRRSEGGGVLWIYLQYLHNIYNIYTLSTGAVHHQRPRRPRHGDRAAAERGQAGGPQPGRGGEHRLGGHRHHRHTGTGELPLHWWTATVLASDWSRR